MLSRPSPEFMRCYIRVDTDFDMKKNTQPLVSLSALHQKHRVITISAKDLLENDIAMRAKIQAMMLAHYQTHQAVLPFWGNITLYRYFCQNELLFSFNPVSQEVL